MIFRQGDIVLVDFDPTAGHEPRKTRPALVVSNDLFNRSTNMTIVCPITSQDNQFYLHDKLPSRCRIQGWIVIEQARAMDLDAREAQCVEQLGEPELSRVLECLRTFF